MPNPVTVYLVVWSVCDSGYKIDSAYYKEEDAEARRQDMINEEMKECTDWPLKNRNGHRASLEGDWQVELVIVK